MPNKLDKAKELMTFLSDSLTRKDFTDSFANVVRYVRGMDERLTNAVQNLHQTLHAKADASHEHLTKGLEDIKRQVDHVFVHDRISKMEAEHAQHMALIKEKIASVRDGKPGMRGLPGKDADHNKVADIVLNNLAKRKITADQIDGLEEYMTKHTEVRTEGQQPTLTAIGVNRPQMTYYDLSSKLDGNTVAFNLPAFQKIVQITLSSFPTILRPTIDFTVSGNTLTFIGQIAANKATILASDQTAIILMLA